jgi:hypothetical protein
MHFADRFIPQCIDCFRSSVQPFPSRRYSSIGYIGYKAYGLGVFTATLILGKMMPVLSLAYFLADKKKAPGVMYKILLPIFCFCLFLLLLSL